MNKLSEKIVTSLVVAAIVSPVIPIRVFADELKNNKQIELNNSIEKKKLQANDIVNIPDANLKSALNKELGKPVNSIIRVDELKNINSFDLSKYNTGSISVNLEGLQYCVNLKSLNLSDKVISDINAISNLINLTNLNLNNTRITNISALSKLTNLKELNLSNNPINDINAISNLVNLTSLNLRGCMINNITCLSKLTNLVMLDLNANQISDISGLKNLMNLKELHLSDNKIVDINVLKNLTNLMNLEMFNNKITNISALSNLTNLTELMAWENKINNLDALSNLTKLKSVNFWKNEIVDINGLKNLVNLEELDLTDNRIVDISSLSNLTNLRTLYAYNNRIKDVRALSNLTNLENLCLSNNQISDISSLSKIDIRKNVTINNQTIYLHTVISKDMTVKNIVKGLDGKYLPPDSISNGGSYDYDNNDIIWNNISSENLSYGFKQNYDYAPPFFSGVVKILSPDSYKPKVNQVTDKSVEVTGKSEAWLTIIVKIGTNTYTTTAGSDGSFKVEIPMQKAGTVISAYAKDNTGNISKIVNVTVLDKTAPAQPSVCPVDDNDTIIVGKAERNSKVYITIGNTVYIGEANANGEYKVKIPMQKVGTTISVYAKDNAGNKSVVQTVKVIDKTPPVKPSISIVTTKTTLIKGNTEKGSIVYICIGNKSYKTTTNSKGEYSFKILMQKAGTVISAYAKDNAGNKSVVQTVKVIDKTPPVKPSISIVTTKTTLIKGNTEKGSIVYICIGNKSYKTTANSKGEYSFKISRQKKGTNISVYAKDSSGNKSSTVNIKVK